MEYIDIHTHNSQSKASIALENIKLINKNQNIPSTTNITIGIHPWDTENIDSNTLDYIDTLSCQSNVFAIGECGIDRLKGADIEIQKEIFIYQAKLAQNTNKPLIIHCVKAHSEIIAIYNKLKPQNPWIVHGFNQNIQIAKELTKHGIYLSFGSSLLNNSSNASKIFPEIAKEYIFAETDESKIDIKDIYIRAAKLRKISLTELSNIINSNYKRCFKNE